MSRRRLLDDSYKKTVEGNPAIAQGSLARMYPGITMQGWTEQASTTGAQLINQDETVIGGLAGNTGNEFDITNRIRTGFIRVEPNTTYIISGLSGFNIANSFAYDSEKTMARIGAVTTTTTTLENESYLRISFSKPDQSDFTEEELQKLRKTLMFNKGDVALPWEPYTGSQPSPSPDYPQEIVSAGKYNEDTQKWEYEITIANAQTDPDKNQTVTLTSDRPLTKWDKLEKRNGQWGWVYKSGVKRLISDMNIFKNTEGTYQVANFVKVDRNRLAESLSTHFIYKLSTMEYGNFWFDSVGTGLRFRMSQFQTVEEVKDWLQENEVYFAFPNAEETFVPLTAAEQEQMNALHTYRPTTVLSNDCDCNMSLTYKTKKSMGGGNLLDYRKLINLDKWSPVGSAYRHFDISFKPKTTYKISVSVNNMHKGYKKDYIGKFALYLGETPASASNNIKFGNTLEDVVTERTFTTSENPFYLNLYVVTWNSENLHIVFDELLPNIRLEEVTT